MSRVASFGGGEETGLSVEREEGASTAVHDRVPSTFRQQPGGARPADAESEAEDQWMLPHRQRCGRVLSAEELCVNDEEARPGGDGNDQKCVCRNNPHACAPLLAPVRARPNQKEMSVRRK
jgi:hypothetical protein